MIFLSKIEPVIAKKKLIYVSFEIFWTAKKFTVDRNVQFHHITLTSNYFLYKKLLAIGPKLPSFEPKIKSFVSCTPGLSINIS